MTASGILRITVAGLRVLACFVVLLTSALGSASAGGMAAIEVASAQVAFNERMKEAIISIKFTELSKPKLREFTSRNIGKPAEFRADAHVLVRAVIREPMLGGSVEITGLFTVEEAQKIVDRLAPGTKVEIEALVD